MAWTQQQREIVFEDFWRTGHSRCPNDQSVIRFQLTPLIDGQYILACACPRCGDGLQMGREHDPRQAAFRYWTEIERSELIDAFFRENNSNCPVCESPVEAQSNPYIGGVIVTMRCLRCGNRHNQNFPGRRVSA